MMPDGSTSGVLDRARNETAAPIGARRPRHRYLPPGHLVVCSNSCTVVTIVGSCVAICLVDRVARVGGMNHYLLPYNTKIDDGLRYGVVAIPRLIAGVLAAGGRKNRLEAKVFGGANVIGVLANHGDHLGNKNVQLAYRLLSESRIPIVAEDVNGTRGRKVLFDPDEGTAWVKRL